MKQFMLLVFYTGIALHGFAIEFTIAPLYYLDETSERVFPQNNFQNRILQELGKVSTNMEVQFKKAVSPRYNPPQTVGDAIIMCRSEEADYLVYGFISRKEYTIQGELRLLDYKQKTVIANFYSMDSKDRETEMVQDLAAKLLYYVQETYNIKIISEPPSFTHIQFPVSLGYWLPINLDWVKILYGIVRVDGGIQIIPTDIVTIDQGKIFYFSFGADISYQLGMGRNYNAWNHGFTITSPVQFHWKFNEQHEAYFALGVLYTFDLLYIKNPYEDPSMKFYSVLGAMTGGGWTFRLNEKLFFFTDARLELRSYERAMLSFTPRAGIIFRRYSQEVIKKW